MKMNIDLSGLSLFIINNISYLEIVPERGVGHYKKEGITFRSLWHNYC